MANNETNMDADGDTSITHKNSSVAIAIILPSLFAIILVLLVLIAFLMPKLTQEESSASKEERRRKRLARLDRSVKAQHFVDWKTRQSVEHPDKSTAVHALCVICLEEFDDAAQIRGLGCLHVFHQECLDDWFGRWNEYCPLCHRPIIQGVKGKKREGERGDEVGVGFLV